MNAFLEVPVELSEWMDKNEPDDDLSFKGCYADQLHFVRNILLRALYGDDSDKAKHVRIMVVATHESHSVVLPVYQFTLPNGVKITLRNNFFNWKVSVDSPFSISMKPLGLFDSNRRIQPYHCDGFPEEIVFGSYDENRKRFTLSFLTDYHLWTFMFLLRNAMMLSR